jgi:hypothetical protein
MTEKRLLTAEEVSERYRRVTTVKASAKDGRGINEPRAAASRNFPMVRRVVRQATKAAAVS